MNYIIEMPLTRWGQVKHICFIIGSDNGLLTLRCKDIIWPNAGVWVIGRLKTNCSEFWFKIQKKYSRQCIWKCRRQHGDHDRGPLQKRWYTRNWYLTEIPCIIPMMTSSDGNMFRVTGPLCGEFTGDGWIPLTKASDADILMFSLICPWINGWVNNREAGDLRRNRGPYEVSV